MKMKLNVPSKETCVCDRCDGSRDAAAKVRRTDVRGRSTYSIPTYSVLTSKSSSTELKQPEPHMPAHKVSISHTATLLAPTPIMQIEIKSRPKRVRYASWQVRSRPRNVVHMLEIAGCRQRESCRARAPFSSFTPGTRQGISW